LTISRNPVLVGTNICKLLDLVGGQKIQPPTDIPGG
jgi:hypothetical protein